MSPSELALALRLSALASQRWSARARRIGVDPDDLRQAGLLSAILALRTFNPRLGSLEHHLRSRIRIGVFRELRRLSSPVYQGRDHHDHRAESIELSESHGSLSTDLQELSIDGRGLQVQMEELAGIEGARVVVLVLAGLVSRREAAGMLGLSERDLGTVIAAMLWKVQK